MAKVFITGATGQVGGQLVKYLLAEKKLSVNEPSDLICLVRNPAKASNLAALGVTIVKGDLQDSDTIVEIMQNGIDYVFHIAADININHTYEQLYPPNVLGTRIMLDAFVNSKAKCFIFASSISVYDVEKRGVRDYHITEESNVGKPEGTPYPVTKRLSEAMVFDYVKNNPEKTFIITRLGPIVGPGDRQTLPSLVLIMKYTIAPKLVNRGKFVMSLTSPLDVARAQVFLSEIGNGISGEVYNVANNTITFREIMDTIANYYYRRPPRFSITFWFYRTIKPLLKVLHKIFPRMTILEIALSPLTSHYLGRSYFYSKEKLENLGFKYTIPPKESILSGLQDYDPERKFLKPNRRILNRSK